MPQASVLPRHSFHKRLRSLILGSVLVLSFLGSTAGFAAGQVELVSKVFPRKASDTASGSVGNLILLGPSISADGSRVVFLSTANNLVPGETRTDPANQTADVFLHDRISGATTLVSHSTASPAATSDLGVDEAVISADGRWVAFLSESKNLTVDQTATISHARELFLFDSLSGATTRISHSTFGETNNIFGVRELAISADGQFVAFASDAPDLIPGQQEGNGYLDVFLYDRTTGQTALVSHTGGSTSMTGNSSSQDLSLSADGRFVAFDSGATDLVPGRSGVFLYDRLSGAFRWIGQGGSPTLSADGGTVLFFSDQSDVVPGQIDTNGGFDLFLFDVATGTTTLVSHAAGLPTTAADTGLAFLYGTAPSFSADGRFVAFVSTAQNLVPGQSAPLAVGQAVFLYDKTSGAVTLVSRAEGSPTTPASHGDSRKPSISGDGRFVAFESEARNLVSIPIDVDSLPQIFLFDRNSGTVALVSEANGTPAIGNHFSFSPTISTDGSQVAFYTTVDDLVAGARDFNNGEDVVLHDVATGSNAYATLHAPGEPSATPDAQSSLQGLSADGRFVLYESAAVNLVAGQMDTNQVTDVFLRDRATGANLLVSHAASGPAVAADDSSSQSALSADGRFVAFSSVATNLVAGVIDRTRDPVPGQPSNYPDVFLFDRTTGKTTLVTRSVVTSGVSALGESTSPALSADGRYVAFVSSATDLVAGFDDADGIGVEDVFLYDRVTGTTTLVSRSSASPSRTGDARSFNPVVSADGNFVVYESEASDLVPGQTGASHFTFSHTVFLYDRVAGTNRLVSHTLVSPVDGAIGSVGRTSSVSADGRFVVFASGGGLAGATDQFLDEGYFLFDRLTGAVTLAGGSEHAEASSPVLSADGRWVAFIGNAPFPPVIDDPQFDQVYLFDRIAGTWTLLTSSVAQAGQPAQDPAESVAISANGHAVAFVSRATDLVSGGSGTGRHVFLYDRIARSLAVVAGAQDTPNIFDNSLTPPALLLSMNGHQTAFDSYGPDLVPADFNGRGDVFLLNLDPGPPSAGPVTVPPCALFSQVLRSSVRKVLTAAGSCGVPAGAHQVIAKVTATGGTGKGTVEIFQGDVTTTVAGLLTFSRAHASTGSFTVPLSPAGTLALLPFVRGNGTVKVTVEVDAYLP